jgi:hypothetical protein
MPGDEMPAEAVAQGEGFFEIDRAGPVETGRDAKGFSRHIGGEAAAVTVTVRQTPCTQIESPTATPARSSPGHSTSSGLVHTMRPTACTIPVNMRRRVAQKSLREG